MDYFKLGLLNLLGIIAPGSLLCSGLLLAITGLLEHEGLTGYRGALKQLLASQFFATVLFLLLSFLVGSAIRLFANDFVEIVSGLYLRGLRRKKTRLAMERFPYPVVADWIREKIDPSIVEYLAKRNPRFTDVGNKDFYNYCKMFVQSRSPARAELCERIEAYVRFLAGSFISSLITFVVSLALAILFFTSNRRDIAYPCLGLAVTMLLVAVAILERFRHQHTREVMHTWIAFYDASVESRRANVKRAR